jgi:16S rRNA G966 N2-methylase RsmD
MAVLGIRIQSDLDLFAGSGIFTAKSGSGSSSGDVYLPSNFFKIDVLNQFFEKLSFMI